MNIVVKRKKKKAQQLIEFLLVVPFMVIILGILTEYAYALNINMTLNEGLKTVTSELYSDIKPSMTQSQIKTTLKNNLITYLGENNVPTNSENSITVGYVINGQTTVFMASYTYVPVFTLPNVYFKILPDQFNFFTTAAVPSAFWGQNNYNSSINSSVLDRIWSSAADFSSLNSFNDSKKGVMKDAYGRNNMVFLTPTAEPLLSQPYLIAGWSGATSQYTLDTSDGNIYYCHEIEVDEELIRVCDYIQNFFSYLTSNSYSNIMFIHDNGSWITPSGASDLSDSSVDGILKRALSLTNSGNLSIGNYDNINVSAYNNDISFGNTYNLKTFGSMSFTYTSDDNISSIIGGASPPSYNYDFGSKVN